MINLYLSVLETDDDKNQFEQLYIKYKDKMYSIAYGILHNIEDSEDAVHQTFLTIANNFKKINSMPLDETEAYIIVILRNNSIDIFNKNKKTSEHLTKLDENQAVDIDFFNKIDYHRLIEAILNLPQIYKDVMLMYYLEGFSSKEIAKMFDISINNVCKRLERAKKSLKKELSKEWILWLMKIL